MLAATRVLLRLRGTGMLSKMQVQRPMQDTPQCSSSSSSKPRLSDNSTLGLSSNTLALSSNSTLGVSESQPESQPCTVLTSMLITQDSLYCTNCTQRYNKFATQTRVSVDGHTGLLKRDESLWWNHLTDLNTQKAYFKVPFRSILCGIFFFRPLITFKVQFNLRTSTSNGCD